MITLDFAENYLCKFQNEVQSAHWSYRQVTVHPCVFFYRCQEEECYKTITDYMIFLSDDLSHDSDFAKYVLKSCIDYLKSIGMNTLHFFSDGAGSQYKSRFTFHDLSELQGQYSELTLTRHFFGSSHGKSQCDSCGGTVKNAASRAVVSGSHVIQSARDMFEFCVQKMTISNSECANV